jgi:signal peptidase II
VIDFIDFRVWPVFNVADSAITVGAILIGIGLMLNKDADKTNKPKLALE